MPFHQAIAGATAVEFAITAPIFIVFLYGLLELGRAMLTQGMLVYAVQQGSRFAATNVDSATAQISAIVTGSFAGIDPAPVSLRVTQTPNADGTTVINLTATYSFQTLTPILGTAPITLSASSSSWR